MKKYIYTILTVAAVFSSCSKSLELKEDINADSEAVTTIGASAGISIRAAVSSDGTKVLWESTDKLGVLGTNGSSELKNLAYTLDGGSGSIYGTFKNLSSDITAISAVMYPYQASASWSATDSKLTCEIPSVQKATKNSFDKDAVVMYSICNTTEVRLNYAVNFLKVTVSETNVHSISVSSSTTALSGKMEITSAGVTAASSGSLKSVSLTAGKGNVLEAGDYYIAVKAGNIENPTVHYVYYYDDHTAIEKTKAGEQTLSFAAGTNVKTFSVDFNNGAVTTRKAVQLWEDGPMFAEYNLGANNVEQTGNKYYWTETGVDDAAAKEWGSNWRVPTKDELNEFVVATDPWSEGKVMYCGYIGSSPVICLNFMGAQGGYNNNSVTFPADGDVTMYPLSCNGDYWSGTDDSANESFGYYMSLHFDSLQPYSPALVGEWMLYYKIYGSYYVRPVLL